MKIVTELVTLVTCLIQVHINRSYRNYSLKSNFRISEELFVKQPAEENIQTAKKKKRDEGKSFI